MSTEPPRTEIIPRPAGQLLTVPAIIAGKGEHAARRFLEFFTATIRNANTRAAYARAARDFFAWCEQIHLGLADIEPMHVAAYVEAMTARRSAPTVKQHLAAIKMLFDWLVTGQIVAFNPASSVRGPRHVVKRGKTPVLLAEEARQLLDSIDAHELDPTTGQPDRARPILIGLRDRALISVMTHALARVGAALGMNIEDFYVEGRKAWFRLHEKGGKRHEVPAHHNAADYVYEYIAAAGIAPDQKGPLFRSADGKNGRLTNERMHRVDAWRMIKRRAKAIGLSAAVCNHTFRATGITTLRKNGGSLEEAQEIANHASPKTTMLYDRSRDDVTQDAVERIVI